MSARVSTEIRGDVAYVTMVRSEKLNGLDLHMLRALIDAAKRLKRDREIRAVILQGEGPAFSAGLDFSIFAKTPAQAFLNFLHVPGTATNLYQEVAMVWRELPVPVLAVVHGRCYGGALQIALACDFRFTTPDCDWSVLEAKWGLIPDMTGSITLSELIGIDTAKKLTMTGEFFDGDRAVELGLATASSADPLKDAEALVEELKTRSPDAIASAKRLFQENAHRSPRAALRLERRLQTRLLLGANHKIARAAATAKKAPSYVRRAIG